nr:MAG: major capsid protein [Microvirus sp.]
MMNRNTNSHFAVNPTRIDISRSTFDRSSSVKFSFNVGDVIPFYVDEVLPGDTFNIDTSKVVRMQSLLTPMMDNLYLDTYFFFVPNRLVWEHWRQFNGENTESAWLPATEYSVPQLVAPDGTGWVIGSIADYMGVPTGVPGLSVNALPMRGYALIMNEWFRSENLTDPLNIPTGDATVVGSNGGNYITDVAKGGLPFKAAKYQDYFTAALPSPQKGPDVMIPGGTGVNVPVYSLNAQVPPLSGSGAPLNIKAPNNIYAVFNMPTTTNNGEVYTTNAFTPEGPRYGSPTNLWAVGDSSLATASINQLRLAFQIQKLYERDARGGTRYIEILKSHFGVTSPDSRLQRPEYLGGNRIPININQIVQQSATQSTGTPQGNPVGLSLTTDTHSEFTHSFTEHGFVFGLCVARYDHTYQQGLERFWSRKDRFDYYWPVFANIGEQAILNKEIYAQGPSVLGDDGKTPVDEQVFGYQEAWADYRYKPNRVAGEMRSSAEQSLDVWHLADDYTELPRLSDSWIREDGSTVDRVIAVSSRVSNQLFADVYIKNRTTRPMPLYSIPGLIDHH